MISQLPDFKLNYVNIEGKTFLEFIAETGEIILSNKLIEIENIILHVGDDIFIEGTSKEEITDRANFDLKLVSNDKWKIRVSKCAIFNKQIPSNRFKARAITIKAKKGEISNTDVIKQYQLLEGLEFESHSDITFGSPILNGLKLIKDEVSYFPHSSGFFYVKISMKMFKINGNITLIIFIFF
ncbi:hypothetical protein [Methanobacterium formicicum]|uniref:Uncharacterized protein n=1 Tax=Methanobacterium formicicum (strain DSM 3637 / PP1) TaxID=1204725 RepID=K2RUU2_METFP|nr:hypothetical protein [Methanobacterium formicicum]EKF86550.1 hypothetical protein A994_03668 [Methanobacterium formicicum DSM 3637]